MGMVLHKIKSKEFCIDAFLFVCVQLKNKTWLWHSMFWSRRSLTCLSDPEPFADGAWPESPSRGFGLRGRGLHQLVLRRHEPGGERCESGTADHGLCVFVVSSCFCWYCLLIAEELREDPLKRSKTVAGMTGLCWKCWMFKTLLQIGRKKNSKDLWQNAAEARGRTLYFYSMFCSPMNACVLGFLVFYIEIHPWVWGCYAWMESLKMMSPYCIYFLPA